MSTTIRDVRERNGCWFVTDASGVDYNTRDVLMASLATEYRKHRTVVEITADSWYRRLTAITPVGETNHAA